VDEVYGLEMFSRLIIAKSGGCGSGGVVVEYGVWSDSWIKRQRVTNQHAPPSDWVKKFAYLFYFTEL
jgi:hypothetical protein